MVGKGMGLHNRQWLDKPSVGQIRSGSITFPHSQLNESVTAQGFPLVQRANLATCHCPVAKRDVTE